MDWRETVNGKRGGLIKQAPLLHNAGQPTEGLPRPPELTPTTAPKPASANSAVSHPCLYIGTAGQRCSRPATRSDFCSRHSAPEVGASDSTIIKRAIGVGGIIVVLWPIIIDLIRALFHLLR